MIVVTTYLERNDEASDEISSAVGAVVNVLDRAVERRFYTAGADATCAWAMNTVYVAGLTPGKIAVAILPVWDEALPYAPADEQQALLLGIIGNDPDHGAGAVLYTDETWLHHSTQELRGTK